MHRVHREVTLRVAKEAQAHVLLQPALGPGEPGALQYYARGHCYQAIQRHYLKNLTILSLLPLATRMAGPRETLRYALVRQNYGCSHFALDPHHADPAAQSSAETFYREDAAHELVCVHQDELAIRAVPAPELLYVGRRGRFAERT